jgi:hypothetical protein
LRNPFSIFALWISFLFTDDRTHIPAQIIIRRFNRLEEEKIRC